MDKSLLKELKEKLEEERIELERILSSFSKKDRKKTNDWETKFPQFGSHTSEQDENADEVEEYTNLLPLEYRLELQLLDIERAIEKIKKNKNYGICERCGKEISKERLMVIPETKFCSKCGARTS
ncbi:MAG TPA: TraR/DksA C4-type zinc finger protein [Candidatus Pacearchaeota archaeon]|jgi:DnaK suppressor protein|nr:TraR/DksA C4-type zinc finger protein [Candidatus Pacearchaeota archaeon]HPZ74262.1 TraR/DksA C4-type zinc finger protein [Candidatus Pacearchaeota archaeon]HQD88992.1 TraR/DksA C4-type zinc finger protein [Candidatus Pacearchaeota archaeon]